MRLKTVSTLPVLCLALLGQTNLRAQDTTDPAEVSELQIVTIGQDLVLTWDPVTLDVLGGSESTSHYRIYRSDSPSFVPDRIFHSNLRAESAGSSLTDQQAALRDLPIEFYLVTAVDLAGNEGPFGADVPGDPQGAVIDPPDGASILAATVLVRGTVNDRNAEVRVNGVQAVVGIDLSTSGLQPIDPVPWSVEVTLPPGLGIKTIDTVISDQLGNTDGDTRSVNRQAGDCSGSPDGTPCDDGVSCTRGDRCESGACAGAPWDFPCNAVTENFDEDCARAACNPSVGCVAGFEPSGDSYCCTGTNMTGFCSGGVDAFLCTRDIQCDGAGSCGVNDASFCPNQNDSDADCKVGGPCIGAGGDANGCGVQGDEPFGSPCDLGTVCSTADFCSGGTCNTGGLDDSLCPNQNDADDDCVRGACTGSGTCILVDESFGTPCNGGFECTTSDFCSAGTCVPDGFDHSVCPNRNDSDADCITGSCGATGFCVLGNETAGSPCDGGFECSTADTCSAGICVAGGLDNDLCPNRDDSDADCIRGTCGSSGSCTFMNETFGSPCDGGFQCSTADTCSAGTCQAGGLNNALCGNQDDSDADCKRGVCQPGGVCGLANESFGSACSDGNACTSGDRCVSGACSGTPIPGCP